WAADAAGGLGDAWLAVGDVTRACRHLEEVARFAETAGLPAEARRWREAAEGAGRAAAVAPAAAAPDPAADPPAPLAAGHTTEARAALLRRLKAPDLRSDPHEEARCRANLAATYAAEGRWGQARPPVRVALAQAERLDDFPLWLASAVK